MALIDLPHLTGCMGEIYRLQKALDLLEQVFVETGNYAQQPLSLDLTRKIDEFFGVDDSE